MKNKLLIFIGIMTLTMSFLMVAPKTKAASWYTPDLTDYTFSIPSSDDSLIFKSNDLISGDFYAFLIRDYDFYVSQTLSGALNFEDIANTLHWVADQSLMGSKYGLTPMSFNALPSHVSYNIYNDFDPLVYKGAVNRHVIIFRLDFMGNYGMRINDNIYDYVYSLEVIFQIRINYTSNNYVFNKGYTIHWYDISDMKEYKLYTEMDNYLLRFELISDYVSNYDRGYADGYDDGYNDGYDAGYDDGILVDESEAYQEGYRDGENSKLSKNTESFYSGIEKWLVPAIITVIALGGFVSIAAIKRREQ